MLRRRCPSPTRLSTKIPESSGPRCLITSRIRTTVSGSRRRPERVDIAMPLMPHIKFDFFSVQPLCSLCLRGKWCLSTYQPQRHREHRGRTEKSTRRSLIQQRFEIEHRQGYLKLALVCFNPETISE